MSSINIVKNLQILYFSKKNKETKKLKKRRKKSVLAPPFIHTTNYYKLLAYGQLRRIDKLYLPKPIFFYHKAEN